MAGSGILGRYVERALARADYYIVQRSRRVILAFLVLTLVFSAGLGNVSTDAGTEGFSEDLPANRALEEVNEDFSPTFSTSTGSTQLIQSGTNVLGKSELLAMLRAQDRLESNPELRVASTSSAASIVATTLDPEATATAAQLRAIERATPREIDAAVRAAAARNPRFSGLLSKDFNRRSATASATIGVVTHEIPAGLSAGAGQGGSSPLTPLQQRAAWMTDDLTGITVFGSGIIAQEFSTVIFDSLIIVVPAAVLFIILFLIVAYRDPADLVLGALSLGMAIIWTFGFMGLAGIPFSQILIAVPPLLLAVGIDFGIHTVNRYREEGVAGYGRDESMRRTTDQLLVAFFIVTGTTTIGFMANLTSSLPPIREFGVVASAGIVFTFLVFGVFLPAAKVELDRLRERYPIPTLSTRPLGEGAILGRALSGGVAIARHIPVVFLVVTLVASGGMAYYATGVDTTFSNEDFLPPDETPQYLQDLPEPFRPADYSVTGTLNFLEDRFESGQDDSVTVYVEGPMTRDDALESIWRAGRDPPDSFVSTSAGDQRRAETTSIVTVIRDYAERDPRFAALVARNDANGNGVPDQNLDTIYDYLLDSPARAEALSYMTEDRRSARIVYTTEAAASQSEVTRDAREVADRFRFTATATGSVVVFQAVSNLILESAVVSLAVALVGTVLFLLVIYRAIDGRLSLGVANIIPILVTVTLVGATMRAAGISFNAFTATILAITIGLGIDYSVHVTHRFADEYPDRDLFDALDRTVRGTGGALTGSMLTTVFGIGVLVLSVFPAIGQFGLLTAVSVVYSFLTSLFLLPAALVVRTRLLERFGAPRAAE